MKIIYFFLLVFQKGWYIILTWIRFVDNHYSPDPDADVMGKMWSGITNLFGGGNNKKKITETEEKKNKNNNKDPKIPNNANNKKK